jgi:hypothetical protein
VGFKGSLVKNPVHGRLRKPADVAKLLRAPLAAPAIRSRAVNRHHFQPLFGSDHRGAFHCRAYLQAL